MRLCEPAEIVRHKSALHPLCVDCGWSFVSLFPQSLGDSASGSKNTRQASFRCAHVLRCGK